MNETLLQDRWLYSRGGRTRKNANTFGRKLQTTMFNGKTKSEYWVPVPNDKSLNEWWDDLPTIVQRRIAKLLPELSPVDMVA